jgi:hypothetical protein
MQLKSGRSVASRPKVRKGEVHARNATTGGSGWAAAEHGQRSVAVGVTPLTGRRQTSARMPEQPRRRGFYWSQSVIAIDCVQ